jgi:hypothetical protein
MFLPFKKEIRNLLLMGTRVIIHRDNVRRTTPDVEEAKREENKAEERFYFFLM